MTAREGGRCHGLEINMVERDAVERWRKCWGMDGCWMKGSEGNVSRVSGITCVGLRFRRTLHLTSRRHEFVKGNEAEDVLTVISGCQFRSVSRNAS